MQKIKNKIQKACEDLFVFSHIRVCDVKELTYTECGYKNTNTPPADGWQPIEYFCGAHKHYWLHGGFHTPPAEESARYMLSFSNGNGWADGNPQGLLYLNGKMVQGIDFRHREAYLQADTAYEMYLYVYSNDTKQPFDFGITVTKVDTEAEALYYDMLTPLEALEVLNSNTTEYRVILSSLEQTENILDLREPHSAVYHQSIVAARQFLKENFYDARCSTEDKPVVHCIGHTHLDVEWLWSRRQTREKMQRSMAIMTALMEQFPEYLFTMSQPELYRYLKEEAPEKYAELKTLVKEGRFEPEGAMWLESDCNLVSGESFVRQILHGKKFFKDEFGVESKVLFLPDVFGYSAALPQILKKSGIDYFVTSKISWNDTDMMPYDSFMWQGVDGTEIYTTFITAQAAGQNHEMKNFTTYVGVLNAPYVKGTWDRYQQKEYNTHTLLTYGWGDGGGGPTPEMLERQRRLATGIPGLPVTKTDRLLPFLKEAESEFNENCARLRRMPKWIGELYLEFHRGTYTSIAKNKRNNRKSELMLQKAELLSYTDLFFGGSYDAKGLYDTWRRVLHNQFHDILPGSSIEEVYDGTDKDYAEIGAYGNGVIDEKLTALAQRIGSDGGILVYNPLGFAANAPLSVNGETVETEQRIPAFGWRVLKPHQTENAVFVEGLTAENPYYRLTLDACGRIVSLYDKKAAREIVLRGSCANEFQAFEDHPYLYDAWELVETYKSKMYVLDSPAQITPIVDGTRAGFAVKHTYMQSTITQKIWLYSKSRRIDFENDIDWHNKHQILKVAFPLDIHTQIAAYDIQFGHVYRPTHANTSWDAAKFEVCAHKWVDVADKGYGVALLNDCKYGFNTEGSTLKLTVLKCASDPNPHADEGRHVFSYALLPHEGSLYDAGIIQEAYMFNQPLTALPIAAAAGELPAAFSMVSCDADTVIMETVKKAEADDSMIVRMYEACDQRCMANITVPPAFTKAYLCDMIEQEIGQLPLEDHTVCIPFHNFEIVTLKFKK